MINIFELSGIIGFIFILISISLKNRKEEHIFVILGGIFLEIYSIYIKSNIFIILQIILIIVAIYELARYDFKK